MSMTITASVLKNVNFAACHQGSKIIPSITINGESDQDIILHVRAVPAFCSEYKEKINLKEGKYTISNIPVHLEDEFYRREVIEAKEAMVQIEIYDANDTEKILAFEYIKVHLQPYLHWNRSEWEGSMTAFMQPNDPLVTRVLNRAGELANEEGGRMVGYQNWPNSSAKKQAEWIFRALQEENIHYICPPPGFEFGKAGQKIRIPGMVLREDVKQGTCLDLAVLYATCLEAASLNAVLFLIYGHAFAGVWLEPNSILDKYPYRDWKAVYKETRENNGKLLPVECTWYTDGLGYSFENASKAARSHLEKKDEFHCALDVRVGRSLGYVPAFTYTSQPLCDLNIDYSVDFVNQNINQEAESETQKAFEIFQNEIQKFFNRLGFDFYDNDKESLEKWMDLIAFLKNCPVYGESFNGLRKGTDTKTDTLVLLTKELMQSTPGSYRYEDISNVLWNKVEEGMQNAHMHELEALNAFAPASPLGGMSKEQKEQLKQTQKYETYIKKLNQLLEGHTEKEKEVFVDAAIQIVQGNGEDILNMVEEVTAAYHDYKKIEKNA